MRICGLHATAFANIIAFVVTAYLDSETVTIDLANQFDVTLTCPVGDLKFVLWFHNNEEITASLSTHYTWTFNEVKIIGVNETYMGTYHCMLPENKRIVKEFVLRILNPCTVQNGGCHRQASCTNLDGFGICTCKQNYEGDGKTCKVIPSKLGFAPVWKLKPDEDSIVDSDRRPAVLPCRAIGAPKPSVKAYRIRKDGRAQKLKESGLVLHHPTVEDSGKYFCFARNKFGEIRHNFLVTVRVHGGVSEWSAWGRCDKPCSYGHKWRTRECNNPPPQNGGRFCLERPKEVSGCKIRSCSAPRILKFGFDWTGGGELHLNCFATGIPTPTVQWRYRGRDIPGGKFPGGKSNKALVLPKGKARSGEYSCTIRNSNGFFTSYLNVF